MKKLYLAKNISMFMYLQVEEIAMQQWKKWNEFYEEIYLNKMPAKLFV